MKKTLLLLFALISSVISFSQEVVISESDYTFSLGNKSAIMVSIPFATKEQVEDALKSFMKDWGKHKSSKGEHTVIQGSSKAMGDKLFDAYAVITESKGEQFSIQFGIDLGGAFLNIAGGIKVDDPAVDLAVTMAVLSSNADMPIPQGITFAAELGLSGEVRPVNRAEIRIQEAQKLGYKSIFISKYTKGITISDFKIKVILCEKIEDVVRKVFS